MKAVEKQGGQRLEKVDGLKIWTDDKSWVLVRPSGTEPMIRVFAESDTEEKLGSIFRKFARLVKSASAS
jgi:phosphomannomutase/phosphoglucomutase